MKSFLALPLIAFSFSALADNWVNGYQRKDGTYVQGHYRSNSNNTRNDNYSTKGNYNPYTGSYGTKPRDDYSSGSSYGTKSRSRSYGGW